MDNKVQIVLKNDEDVFMEDFTVAPIVLSRVWLRVIFKKKGNTWFLNMYKERLMKLAQDCEDVSDPACMSHILSYLEELQAEDDDFMETLMKAVQHSTINWKQQWYQKSLGMTRCFKEETSNEKKQYRTDKITKDEGDAIDENWRKFVENYKVPDTPICFARWKKSDRCKNPRTASHLARHYVISYLARGLQRTLPQVYRYFITKYAYPVKGAYGEHEEKIMEICFTHDPKKATMYLPIILGRESRGIYKRLDIANGNLPIRKKVKWTLDLAGEMIKHLLKHTNKRLKELRNTFIDREVWLKIQDEMGIPYYNIRYFWLLRLHPQLFIKEDVKMRTLRIKVFKMLKKSDYKIWKDIRWNEITKEFSKGYTSYFLHYITSKSLVNFDNYLEMSLKKVAKLKIKTLKEKGKNYRLKRLKFNEKLQLLVNLINE